MKAIVYRRFGPPDVLECEEVEKPAPGDDEVLIRVRAASVNPFDAGLMRGAPLPVRVLMRLPKPTAARPGRPGADVAGEVEAVGRKVARFKPGDAVFGCSRVRRGLGSFAEYTCTSESLLAIKPDNVTFEEAASVPVAGATALQGLRDRGGIRPGQRVLINGASGGVGSFAVQIARAFGADVTGVCSAGSADMVRSIGADRVVDYTREDFTRGTQRYDLIFDLVGNHSLSACRRVLTPGGTCVVAGVKQPRKILTRMIAAPVLSLFVSQKFLLLMAKLKKEDLITLGDLMAAGKVKPVIDRRYGLTEAREAVRHMAEGHPRGKIVIRVA